MDWLDAIVTVDTKITQPKITTLKDGMKVGNHTFAQFVAKRAIKDGLGFVPTQALMDGQTDCKSYIQAKIPITPTEFLVFLHELGHCKTKQYPQMRGIGMMYRACENTLENEYNAWVYALKYYRRLGFTLTTKCKGLIREAFGSYLHNAHVANVKIYKSKIEKLTGIEFPNYEERIEQSKNFMINFNNFYDKFNPIKTGYIFPEPKPNKPKPQKSKPENWKPWHDMKAREMKKQWKNMR